MPLTTTLLTFDGEGGNSIPMENSEKLQYLSSNFIINIPTLGILD